MDLGVPPGDLVWPLATLAAGGVLTGLLSGLLGLGGGGVLVPVLFEAFRVIGVDEAIRMHLSVGTTLAVIVPTSLRSFVSHRRRGTVDTGVVRDFALPLVVGVGIGAAIASVIDFRSLTAVWIVCGSAMAARFYLGGDRWRLGDTLPGRPTRSVLGVFMGVMSSLMGIGAAAFMTTWMSLYGQPMTRAVATSAGLGVLIAVPGTLGFVWAGWGAPGLPPLSLGYVSAIGFATIAPISVLVAPLGVRLAHGIPRRWLELAFAVFLSAVCVRLLFTLL